MRFVKACVRIHSIDFYNRIKLYKIFSVLLLTQITQSYIMWVRRVRTTLLVRGCQPRGCFPQLRGQSIFFERSQGKIEKQETSARESPCQAVRGTHWQAKRLRDQRFNGLQRSFANQDKRQGKHSTKITTSENPREFFMGGIFTPKIKQKRR